MAPKGVGRTSAKPVPATAPRRKYSMAEAQKKEKGRSRNACDRCKQKKVKCDGEGQRVCSICRTGDYQCTYAQRPHEDKRQYRKGYVEMVEETNGYYKSGLHQCYRVFEKAAIFNRLRAKYAAGGEPTVQEIITALGVPSTGKPHEAGLAAIDAHLEVEGRPMMIRDGEWDREATAGQIPSPELSSDDEMDEDHDESSQDEQHSPELFPPVGNSIRLAPPSTQMGLNSQITVAQRKSTSPTNLAPPPPPPSAAAHFPAQINTARNPLTTSFLAQLNGMAAGSPHSSPIQPGTPESVALSHYSYGVSPTNNGFPPQPQSRDNLVRLNVNCAPLGSLPLQLDFNEGVGPDGTVCLSDVELQNPEAFEYWNYGPSLASHDPFAV